MNPLNRSTMPHFMPRRTVLKTVSASLLLASSAWSAQSMAQPVKVDTILHNAKIVTLDPTQAEATAIAIRDGVVVATGTDNSIRTPFAQ